MLAYRNYTTQSTIVLYLQDHTHYVGNMFALTTVINGSIKELDMDTYPQCTSGAMGWGYSRLDNPLVDWSSGKIVYLECTNMYWSCFKPCQNCKSQQQNKST